MIPFLVFVGVLASLMLLFKLPFIGHFIEHGFLHAVSHLLFHPFHGNEELLAVVLSSVLWLLVLTVLVGLLLGFYFFRRTMSFLFR